MSITEMILRIIENNINGRKLVMRFKDSALEKRIMEQLGIAVSFYISNVKSRVNNVDVFEDEIIKNQSDKYYFLITKELKWNKADSAKYTEWGYEEDKDILWVNPKPVILEATDDTIPLVFSDKRGNDVFIESPLKIKLNGWNIRCKIGKNNDFEPNTIALKSGSKIHVGSNNFLHFLKLEIQEQSSLEIEDNVKIKGGVTASINTKSSVLIGSGTTMSTGRIRTGRNQIIRIGKDCMFSWDTVLLAHDGHIIWDLKTKKPLNNTTGEKRESITIGDHVWVGGETVIMPLTTIGTGSICGYRSLVRGNIPNNCIVAGIPAKVVKTDIAWSRSNIASKEEDLFALQEEYRQLTEQYPE